MCFWLFLILKSMRWKGIEKEIIGSRSIVQSAERIVISAVISSIIFMDMVSSLR